MAWMCGAKPRASTAATASFNSSGSQLGRPFECGQSQYGSSIAPVADSMTPSAKNLMVVAESRPGAAAATRSRVAVKWSSCDRQLLGSHHRPRSARKDRTPSSAAASQDPTSCGSTQASWTHVSPAAANPAEAKVSASSACSRVMSGIRL